MEKSAISNGYSPVARVLWELGYNLRMTLYCYIVCHMLYSCAATMM